MRPQTVREATSMIVSDLEMETAHVWKRERGRALPFVWWLYFERGTVVGIKYQESLMTPCTVC